MRHLLYLLLLLPWILCGQINFTQITDVNNPAVSFSNTVARYKGAVWIDLDHDNLPDLFVSQKFLFHNLGNGQFAQLPDVAGVTLGQAASGSSWADVNNDGYPDCISTSVVSGLHYNNGDQTFTLQNSLLSDFASYRGWDCSMADADNNGLLDLFFAHADNFPPGSVQQPCKLYLQVVKDSFVLVTGNEFAEQFKPYTIPIWTDFDLDGDMDLLIGSGPGGTAGPDFCYRNMLKENGVFSLQRLTTFPFDQLQDGQVYSAVDFDNDGDLDICLSNYAGAKTRFYRNDAGVYTDVNTPFTQQNGYLSNVWGDLDNDGDLDVLISLDGDSNVYYHQNNAGTFASAASLGTAGNGVCGISLADYDNDGDLDVYTNGESAARALFRNEEASANNWLQISLEGQQSNRSAIGTLLRVKATINGQPVWQIREVTAHNSFQGQHDLRQHFGLGDAVTVDSLEVRWPSGLVQRFSGLASNNFLNLIENQNVTVILSSKEPERVTFELRPNPVGREFEVQTKSKIDRVQLFDASGKDVAIKQELSGNKGVVHLLGNPAAGQYFVRVIYADKTSAVQAILKI